MEKQSIKIFWIIVGITFVIKSLLAIAIPLTSDEAYFLLWGQNLDFGYYDHTPMTGWLLHFVLLLGKSELLVRLPSLIVTTLVGIGIFFILKKRNYRKAILTALLFLISPINLLYVLMSTDTPLILFVFISVYFLYQAIETENYSYYLLSGVFLGLAFLSKYFAVLLGLAYLVYWAFTGKNKKTSTGFLLLFLMVIPAILINLYWNCTHSWVNILFNLLNRNVNEKTSLGKVLLFIIGQLYLITPPFIYYLLKKKREFTKKTSADKLFLYIFLVPLIVFFILSLKKRIGLHWVLSFYPFIYVLAFDLLEESEIYRSIKFMTVFSVGHLILIISILSLPLKYVRNNKNYKTIVMGLMPEKIVRELKNYENDYVFSTESYAESALMSYFSDHYFIVFGMGSHHARQDDIITDFRKLNGKNILILKKEKPLRENYSPYFQKVEVKETPVLDTTFYFLLGNGFIYQNYRNKILFQIKNTYYRIPPYLPTKHDYFAEKYSF